MACIMCRRSCPGRFCGLRAIQFTWLGLISITRCGCPPLSERIRSCENAVPHMEALLGGYISKETISICRAQETLSTGLKPTMKLVVSGMVVALAPEACAPGVIERFERMVALLQPGTKGFGAIVAVALRVMAAILVVD